jgi:hypothetical protein
MSAAQRHVQKPQRIENRCWYLLKRVEQTAQRGIRSATAIGMAAHAIDDDQKRRVVIGRNGDAVLVIVAITDQTQLCMLDPQAAAPAGDGVLRLLFGKH